MAQGGYFTEFTLTKAVLYSIAVWYVGVVSFVMLIEPFVETPCNGSKSDIEYENPVYDDNPCQFVRFPNLMFLNRQECVFGRRLVMSVILGGFIGWERRQADRPAGIRTMALVSLGSAQFSICAAFAFVSGSQEWDASRIAAAIPSGVGFLGAGIIYKAAVPSDGTEGSANHVVHGLTTAASLWLSSAVGIACGGGLFFPASFCTAIILVLLRFGPRNKIEEEDEVMENEDFCEGSLRNMEYHSVNTHNFKRDDLSMGSPESKSLVMRRQLPRNQSRAILV